MKKYRLLEKIYQNAWKQPDLPALYYRSGKNVSSLSYYEVWAQIKECQKYYTHYSGKRVGILGGNTWQWFCSTFGMIAAGLTTALLDPLAPVEDLIEAVRKSDLQVLVYDEEEEETAKEIHERLPEVQLAGYCPLPAVSRNPAAPVTDFPDQEGEVLFFTSGTSKNFKVVVIPAEAMEGSMAASEPLAYHKEGELIIIPIPFHHAFGFNMLNMYYLSRCPIFISSSRRVMKDIPAVRPSAIAAVPHMLEYLYSKNLLNPTFIKSVITAGSRLPLELAQKIESLGIIVQNFYGSSEIPGGIGSSLPGESTEAIALNAYVQVQILDDGEVVIHCPFHMSEYYGNPEDTSDVLHGDTIYTGDAGYLDEKGRLHLLGRKKDTIVMENGEKIYCPDVDGAIKSFTGVKDGALIYVWKKLVAVVEPEKNVKLQQIQRELDEYNSKQPYYRKIADLWIYPGSFPYTSSGKMQRRILESSYKEEYSKKNHS